MSNRVLAKLRAVLAEQRFILKVKAGVPVTNKDLPPGWFFVMTAGDEFPHLVKLRKLEAEEFRKHSVIVRGNPEVRARIKQYDPLADPKAGVLLGWEFTHQKPAQPSKTQPGNSTSQRGEGSRHEQK
jgi:hypothetical protein